LILDLEGLMAASKDKEVELRTALVDLMKPLKERNDWKLKVCLYQASRATDWQKVTLQNDVMRFFVSEAALPVAKVECVTKIVPEGSNMEFGFRNHSSVFVELEFVG